MKIGFEHTPRHATQDKRAFVQSAILLHASNYYYCRDIGTKTKTMLSLTTKITTHRTSQHTQLTEIDSTTQIMLLYHTLCLSITNDSNKN